MNPTESRRYVYVTLHNGKPIEVFTDERVAQKARKGYEEELTYMAVPVDLGINEDYKRMAWKA
jgi:hypothetical protein